ncbi:hypothetical protein ACWIGM_02635 [Bosea sp. NPDC055332]
MSVLDDLYCPFRSDAIAAVPIQLAALLHATGLLALLLLQP